MFHTFQDRDNLYMVQEFMPGGDLRYHLNRKKVFNEAQTSKKYLKIFLEFFAACVVEGLSYIHSLGYLHRDIKPGNLMFDLEGYLRIGDFGLAMRMKNENKDHTSGTPGYMAPEVMCRQNHSVAADFYSLGVICYECMLGRRPYTGQNRTEIRNKILNNQVQVKKHEIPEGWSLESADFINRLIQRKPINRLGSNGAIELKNHDWLKNFNWIKLSKKRIEAHKIYRTKDVEIKLNPVIDDDDIFAEFQTLAKNDNEKEFIREKGYLLNDDSVQNLFSNFEIDRDEYYSEVVNEEKDNELDKDELEEKLNLMLLE